MINIFSQMACICHFVLFYVLPRASYGYIQCGFISSAVWRFSNHFQLLRCRILSFNRVAAGMFYTWGYLDGPTFVHPCNSYTPYICTILEAYTPICPSYSSVHQYVLRGFCKLLGGCRGPLHVGHLPYPYPCMGVPPHVYTPHSFTGFPVHQYVSGISACDVGNISLMLGVWGRCSPSVGGLGHQHMGHPYAYSCTFL